MANDSKLEGGTREIIQSETQRKKLWKAEKPQQIGTVENSFI